MTTDELLAAYAAGELDAADAAAVEADLSADPALRARLDAIRSSDALLASLDDVPLPAGFSAELRSTLGTELDLILGDELATRRARRSAGLTGSTSTSSRMRWVSGLGAAAALAAIVGVGVNVLGNGSDQDAGRLAFTANEAEMADADDMSSGAMAEAPLAPQDGADATADMAEETLPSSTTGLGGAERQLVIVSGDRLLTTENLELLTDDPLVAEVVAGARETSPNERAYAYRAPAPDTEGASQPAGTDNRDQARADVERCASALDDASVGEPVVIYAEVGLDETDAAVIAYVTISNDDQRDVIRTWLVDVATCQVLARVEPANQG